jgi:DnaJ-class molecular chaperone
MTKSQDRARRDHEDHKAIQDTDRTRICLDCAGTGRFAGGRVCSRCGGIGRVAR